MTISLDDVRTRAVRFRTALVERKLAPGVGEEEPPPLADLCADFPLLAGDEVLPAIERELAGASGEEERRLRRLLEWAAAHRVRIATAPLDDEYATWHKAAEVDAEGEALSLREVEVRIGETGDRPRRAALEAAWAERVAETAPLQLERARRRREALEDLGYGDFVHAGSRLAGFSLESLVREARRVLEATGDAYRDDLTYRLRRAAATSAADAASHDARWLTRMPWLDAAFDSGTLLERVRRDLTELGLPLERRDRVKVRPVPRPAPGIRAFCAPLEVPGRIELVVTPTESRPDFAALLEAVGCALHCAYTDEDLPAEDRVLGDPSVSRAHARLFERLVSERTWVERSASIPRAELDDYLRTAALVDLYAFRAEAARLEFGLELHGADPDAPSMVAAGEQWAAIAEEATGFRHHALTFPEPAEAALGAARALRARMLAEGLSRDAMDRFGDDWFRNPEAGSWLGGRFASGLREEEGVAARANGDALIERAHAALA